MDRASFGAAETGSPDGHRSTHQRSLVHHSRSHAGNVDLGLLFDSRFSLPLHKKRIDYIYRIIIVIRITKTK
jgi:hypothetical protein